MEQQQSGTKERVHTGLKKPKFYKVIFFNDDFTTMDFVVEILTNIFFKSSGEAEQLMLRIHQKGSAVVGTYPYDIALSKVHKATVKAREAGFPLRLTVSPEDDNI